MAGTSLLAPAVTSGISSLFGLDELSEEEKRANALRQESINRLTAAAEGRTASPAQLAALAQQQRTQQALAGLAQKGSVQQRAGNVRAAMQAAPEVMAQQGAIAAQTRAEEMARARDALAAAQLGVANQDAAAGQRKREQQRALIGAGVQGVGTAAALSMMSGDAAAPAAAPAAESPAAAAAPSGPTIAAPAARAPKAAAGGMTSEQVAKELNFTPAAAAAPAAPAGGLSLGPSVGNVIGGGASAIGKGIQSLMSPLSLGLKRAGMKSPQYAGMNEMLDYYQNRDVINPTASSRYAQQRRDLARLGGQ
jgi:hypothetical protein